MGKTLVEDLPAGETVLLDTMVLVYFLERHSRFYRPARQLLDDVESGTRTAVASTLMLAELLVPTHGSANASDAKRLSALLTTFPNLDVVPVSAAIATRAAELRASHHFKTPDAIHIATAAEKRAQWLVTNDKAWERATEAGFQLAMFEL